MGIKIDGMQSLLKKLKAMGGDVDAALKQGILAGSLLVERDAKLNVKTNTGALRESINHEVVTDEKSIVGIIGTNFKYAPYIELGTGPVGEANKPQIAAKKNVTYRSTPWVYFSEEKQSFFTTSGQAGVPYLYPALANNREQIKLLVAEAVYRAFKDLGGK